MEFAHVLTLEAKYDGSSIYGLFASPDAAKFYAAGLKDGALKWYAVPGLEGIERVNLHVGEDGEVLEWLEIMKYGIQGS